MTDPDLEDIYGAIALKIDEVGTQQSELFLAKLALLLAHKIGDANEIAACINGAAASLVEGD